jgi:hypothetical protein
MEQVLLGNNVMVHDVFRHKRSGSESNPRCSLSNFLSASSLSDQNRISIERPIDAFNVYQNQRDLIEGTHFWVACAVVFSSAANFFYVPR